MFILKKGDGINLTKEVPDLNEIAIGIGWVSQQTDNSILSLDIFMIPLDENNKTPHGVQFNICGTFDFLNNFVESIPDKYDIEVISDNCDNDIEKHQISITHPNGKYILRYSDYNTINMSLKSIQTRFQKIIIIGRIYEAKEKNQNFGQTENLYIRLMNSSNENSEICRYNLSTDGSNDIVMVFGGFCYNNNNNWIFKAIGEGCTEDLLN